MTENHEEVKYNWDLDKEGNLVEKYSDQLEDGDKKLSYNWTLWEQFEAADKQQKPKFKQYDEKFVSNMRKVGYFNTVFGFCRLSNNVPHFNLLNFFYDYIR